MKLSVMALVLGLGATACTGRAALGGGAVLSAVGAAMVGASSQECGDVCVGVNHGPRGLGVATLVTGVVMMVMGASTLSTSEPVAQ